MTRFVEFHLDFGYALAEPGDRDTQIGKGVVFVNPEGVDMVVEYGSKSCRLFMSGGGILTLPMPAAEARARLAGEIA